MHGSEGGLQSSRRQPCAHLPEKVSILVQQQMKHPQRGLGGGLRGDEADSRGVRAGFELVVEDQGPWKVQAAAPVCQCVSVSACQRVERARWSAIHAELDLAGIGAGGDEKATAGALEAELELRVRELLREVIAGVLTPRTARRDRAAEENDATGFLLRELALAVRQSIAQLEVVMPLRQLGGIVFGLG